MHRIPIAGPQHLKALAPARRPNGGENFIIGPPLVWNSCPRRCGHAAVLLLVLEARRIEAPKLLVPVFNRPRRATQVIACHGEVAAVRVHLEWPLLSSTRECVAARNDVQPGTARRPLGVA